MPEWWVRGRQESGLLGPGYDIWLDIGDSNTHFSSSYDSLLDVSDARLKQMTQSGTIETAVEPNIDHVDNASSSSKIGYGSTLLRDYYIPNHLESGRTVLWLPTGASGFGVGGSRFWTTLTLSTTIANGSTSITMPSSPTISPHPTPAYYNWVYGTGIQAGTRLTARTGTTGTLSLPATADGTFDLVYRGAGVKLAVDRTLAALASGSGTNRLVGCSVAVGTNDVFGEAFFGTRLQEMAADLRSQIGLGNFPMAFLGMVETYTSPPNKHFLDDILADVASIIPNSAYGDTTGTVCDIAGDPFNPDGKHFLAANQRTICAPNLYSAWQSLL